MTFRACSSPAPTRVKPQPAPAILSQESVHTTLSITHHTRKRPSTGPRTTHGPQLHNFTLNAISQAATFFDVREGFLGIPVNWDLWVHLFRVELHTLATPEPKTRRTVRTGEMTIALRNTRREPYIPYTMNSNNAEWERGWFYLRNDGSGLPPTPARSGWRRLTPGTMGYPRLRTRRGWIRSWWH
jgi:hypothetical protein